jgi:hypothetical protein
MACTTVTEETPWWGTETAWKEVNELTYRALENNNIYSRSQDIKASMVVGLVDMIPVINIPMLAVQATNEHASPTSRVLSGAGAVLAAVPPLGALRGIVAASEEIPLANRLYHYTTEEGLNAILTSGELNPSLKALNPADARYGNGQYLTDVVPGSASADSLSARFLGVPRQGARFSHYVEIDTTGLTVDQGRKGVFVVPNEEPLDISGRIMSFGEGY